jgi:hypothetical protein
LQRTEHPVGTRVCAEQQNLRTGAGREQVPDHLNAVSLAEVAIEEADFRLPLLHRLQRSRDRARHGDGIATLAEHCGHGVEEYAMIVAENQVNHEAPPLVSRRCYCGPLAARC